MTRRLTLTLAAGKRIYLCGFMGAGKSKNGHLLADALDGRFVDLDDQVTAAADLSVSEIFQRWGETYFRELEHACLLGTEKWQNVVVATGGGTFSFARNREAIARLGLSVWLDVDFEVIVGRMSADSIQRRPLFRDREHAKRLFTRRLRHYRDASLRVGVEREATPQEVTARILNLLREKNCVI